jgi:hypothetical protein
MLSSVASPVPTIVGDGIAKDRPPFEPAVILSEAKDLMAIATGVPPQPVIGQHRAFKTTRQSCSMGYVHNSENCNITLN